MNPDYQLYTHLLNFDYKGRAAMQSYKACFPVLMDWSQLLLLLLVHARHWLLP